VQIFGISIGIDRSADENTLGDLTPDERERYMACWRKFKMLDRLAWLGVGLLLAGSFSTYHHRPNAWQPSALLGLAIFLTTRIWLRVLTCPRCGATYSGGLITIFQKFSFLNKCYGCNLSQNQLRALERRGY
jgi:hypothetical protein